MNDINALIEMEKFDSIEQALLNIWNSGVSIPNADKIDNPILNAINDLKVLKMDVIDICDGLGYK